MLCCAINALINVLKQHLAKTHITFQDLEGWIFVNYGHITMLTKTHLEKAASTFYKHAEVYIMTVLR